MTPPTIDEVAIQRAYDGHKVTLTIDERRALNRRIRGTHCTCGIGTINVKRPHYPGCPSDRLSQAHGKPTYQLKEVAQKWDRRHPCVPG